MSSLDGDLRKLRLDKYTPAAANEARSWVESVLGERLPSGDFLDSLKDGVALCRYDPSAIIAFASGPSSLAPHSSLTP